MVLGIVIHCLHIDVNPIDLAAEKGSKREKTAGMLGRAYICRVIGNLIGVPIWVYQGENLLLYHSIIHLPKDPMEIYREDIWQATANVSYFVTKHFHYYGIINSGETKIVIGPTRQIPESNQKLRELAFQADVPTADTEEFVEGMRCVVHIPLESIMQILFTVNYILNDEKLELEDITIYDSEQNDLKELLERQRITRVFSPKSSDSETYTHEHNTYTQEQQMLRMVRNGDIPALREWITSAPAIRGGTLASDQLRQVKNMFVVTATLVSRAAIQGGFSTEDAFSLSDAYIQKCELLNSLERITNPQYHMILEFTECVEQIRFGGKPTQLTVAVINYIQRHLSEPIRAEGIAKELFMSRPYLSARFKEETGETLTDFILKEKTEEAKRLLATRINPLQQLVPIWVFIDRTFFPGIQKIHRANSHGISGKIFQVNFGIITFCIFFKSDKD